MRLRAACFLRLWATWASLHPLHSHLKASTLLLGAPIKPLEFGIHTPGRRSVCFRGTASVFSLLPIRRTVSGFSPEAKTIQRSYGVQQPTKSFSRSKDTAVGLLPQLSYRMATALLRRVTITPSAYGMGLQIRA